MEYTESAMQQLKRLFSQDMSKKYFRIAILGGGCSGFQYEFTIASDYNEDDYMVSLPEECVCCGLIIDSISAEYLENAVLDYKKDLSGARFVIKNPKAQRICGCGMSISFD